MKLVAKIFEFVFSSFVHIGIIGGIVIFSLVYGNQFLLSWAEVVAKFFGSENSSWQLPDEINDSGEEISIATYSLNPLVCENRGLGKVRAVAKCSGGFGFVTIESECDGDHRQYDAIVDETNGGFLLVENYERPIASFEFTEFMAVTYGGGEFPQSTIIVAEPIRKFVEKNKSACLPSSAGNK